MPRRRPYTDGDLAVAAKQVFWDRGYERTAIDDLQDATGLSRSSLYLAFDTKRALFDAALAEYVTSFIDPRLRPVEAPDAGLRGSGLLSAGWPATSGVTTPTGLPLHQLHRRARRA